MDIESIDQNYGLPESYERCVRFMLAVLASVTQSLAEPAREALERANAHWSKERNPAALSQAKARLWAVLDHRGQNPKLNDAEEAGARAVLCVLDEFPATEDIVELLDWFLQFLRASSSGDPCEIASLLREHFP